MEESKIGYKVVVNNRDAKKLHSFNFYPGYGQEKCREYNINEWTTPFKRCGPLCLFDAIDNAERFVEDFRSVLIGSDVKITLRIYEAEYISSRFKHVWYRFENLDEKYDESATGCVVPADTIFAKKIKLIRLVKELINDGKTFKWI